jgi:cell division protein YceG involved in septum cleavage
MIKLKDLLKLKEAQETEKPEYSEEAVFKFFGKNKAKLKKFYEDNDWDEFYELAFDEFSEQDQDVVATALNRAATMEGWFDNETEDYRQSEAELDMMANGTKQQQKGVDTADYDKKAKMPKTSPTDLVVGDLKKLKESKKKYLKSKSSKKLNTKVEK